MTASGATFELAEHKRLTITLEGLARNPVLHSIGLYHTQTGRDNLQPCARSKRRLKTSGESCAMPLEIEPQSQRSYGFIVPEYRQGLGMPMNSMCSFQRTHWRYRWI